MFPALRSGFLLALAACFAGCAADDTARRLAATTARQLADYEKQVERKIAAESALYRNQAVRLSAIESNELQVEPESKVPAKRLFATMRIEAQASADAIRAWDKFVASGSAQPRTMIVDELSKGSAADKAAIAEAVEARRRMQDEFLGSMRKLNSQKAKIQAARKQLESLAKKPGTGKALRDAIEFGISVREGLAELEKQQSE